MTVMDRKSCLERRIGHPSLEIAFTRWPPNCNVYHGICTKLTINIYYSGDDDVFSTDFTDDEIKKLFEGVDRPIVWVYGEKDEYYMPSNGDPQKSIDKFMRLVPAIKEGHLVPDADHCITDKEAQKVFCKIVSDFLSSIDKA